MPYLHSQMQPDSVYSKNLSKEIFNPSNAEAKTFAQSTRMQRFLHLNPVMLNSLDSSHWVLSF